MPHYRLKPVSPVLDTAHRLNKGLECAWLFTDRYGNIVNDYSGNGRSGLATVSNYVMSPWGNGFYGSTLSMGPVKENGFDQITIMIKFLWDPSGSPSNSFMDKSYSRTEEGNFSLRIRRSGSHQIAFTSGPRGNFRGTGWLPVNQMFRTWSTLVISSDSSGTIILLNKDKIYDSQNFVLQNADDRNRQRDIRVYSSNHNKISEVRVWSRALPIDEMIELSSGLYEEFQEKSRVESYYSMMLNLEYEDRITACKNNKYINPYYLHNRLPCKIINKISKDVTHPSGDWKDYNNVYRRYKMLNLFKKNNLIDSLDLPEKPNTNNYQN